MEESAKHQILEEKEGARKALQVGASKTDRLDPLFRAALVAGSLDLIRLHLNRTQQINGFDHARQTPLMIAACRGRQELCKVLLAAGADPFIRDSYGQTALDLAIRGHHVD